MTKYQPLGDKVLVSRIEAEEKSPGGILLPESAKKKPTSGKVVAVGDGKILPSGDRQRMDVKEGDVVYFGQWNGTEITLEGEKYLILSEGDLLLKDAGLS